MTVIFLIETPDDKTYNKISDVLIHLKSDSPLILHTKELKAELVDSGATVDIVKITVCGEKPE